MTLEKQVCSLNFSKQLKDLGVKPTSNFYWDVDYPNGVDFDFEEASIKLRPAHVFDLTGYYKCNGLFAAFTVAELGVLIGRKVNDVSWHTLGWRVWLDVAKENYFETEAEARAYKLIYMIKNGEVEL